MKKKIKILTKIVIGLTTLYGIYKSIKWYCYGSAIEELKSYYNKENNKKE